MQAKNGTESPTSCTTEYPCFKVLWGKLLRSDKHLSSRLICQGIFLLKDPCDNLSLLVNIYLFLGPAEAFSKKGISDFELITLK